MSFKPSNISSINFQLEDIFPCKSYSISLSDLNDTQPISEAYYSACVALIVKIRQSDGRVTFLPTIEAVSIIDVYAAVEDLRPHFGISSSILKYRLLTFLCAHLQAEGIAVYENNKKNVQEKGKVLFQLQKICRDLQIIDEGSDNKEAVISKVISRLTERLEEIPESLLLDPPKILARLQSDGRSVDELFNVKQIGTVSRVVELLYEDFHLRRQMLMKRLDVTIESFLCAKKAEGKEGHLVTIIKAQRDHLSKVPIKYTLKDALDAPISLLHESSKRVTDLGERSGGRLKIMEIMTGSVPDRGGRANEVREKPLTAGRGGGGRGVGGGGRGGSGGGGGRSGGGGGRKGGNNSGGDKKEGDDSEGGKKVEGNSGGGKKECDYSGGDRKEAENSEGGKKRGDNSGGDRNEGENSGGDRKRGDNSGGGRKGRSRRRRDGGNEAVKEKEGAKMEVTEGNISSVDVAGEGKRKRDDDRNT